MSRFRSWVWLWAAGLLLGAGALSAQAGRLTEELLPEETAGFVAVSRVEELSQRWSKTQLGQLMADEALQPFAKDLRRQVEDRWSGLRERLGLTLDDLRDVPGGEVGVGLILRTASDKTAKGKTDEDKALLAVVVDVTGHLPQAKALLEKVSKNLMQQGANRSELPLPETPFPIVRFDNLPKPKDDPLADPGEAFYFLSGDLLVASDDLQVIRGIMARLLLPPGQGNGLADLPAFKAVMGRCARDNGGTTPQIRWFIQPLRYVGAIRAATPEKHRRKGKSVLEMMQNQGFAALQGVGGFIDFYVTDEYQLVHRSAVYAPRKDLYKKSMKMLKFPNGTEFAPQRWVPRDVATYTTFYVDILNAFDNVGPLINEWLGPVEFLFDAPLTCQAELDKGVLPKRFRKESENLDITISPQVEIVVKKADTLWEIKDNDETYTVKKRDGKLWVYAELDLWREVLEGLEDPEDPASPHINLRKELISHLRQRVTVITAYNDKAPITASERLLFAIEIDATKEQAVKAAIEKTMKTNADVKLRKFEEHIIWEMIEEEQTGPPEVPRISIPSLTGEGDPGQEEEEDEEKDTRLLPHAAVTVADGHLFVASHIDFLKEVLEDREPRDMLAANVDWQLIEKKLEQMGIAGKCALVFSRTDEEYRPTYELIRRGKMPQSETMLARVLNAIFSTGKKGEFRTQKIDGSKMPEYDVVRRYLGAAGMAVTSESTGWFFKGFTLKK